MVEVSENGLKDEEVVLDLGLTIGGGNFKKQEKLISNGAFVVDSRENEYQNTALFLNSGSSILDPQMKREMQALRRQVAKRKRVEKKSRPGKNEPKMEDQAPPASKKKRTDLNLDGVSEGGNSVNAMSVSLNLSNGRPEHHPYPVEPGQYPYPPVQFVPYSNGFAYPCVMPHFGGGGFRPFQVTQGKNGCQLEQNGGLIKTASLKVSPICSASTVSDHYSGASHEGGSSDTKSHSTYFNGSIAKETKNKFDHTATSNSFESNSKLVQPKEEEAKLISPNEESSTPTLLKENKMEPPKDRAPNTGYTQKTTTTLPQMPYVSTTGNGPNGRTVHGFLYRYSKSEISIVCVCHGSTFSPAAFVQHAGGTDVSQPLRHIIVNPSAF